jgi:hypothetical protein
MAWPDEVDAIFSEEHAAEVPALTEVASALTGVDGKRSRWSSR